MPLVAAAILDLLVELRKELYMFIGHDLKTVRAICDEVMVLYAGRIVEMMPCVYQNLSSGVVVMKSA